MGRRATSGCVSRASRVAAAQTARAIGDGTGRDGGSEALGAIDRGIGRREALARTRVPPLDLWPRCNSIRARFNELLYCSRRLDSSRDLKPRIGGRQSRSLATRRLNAVLRLTAGTQQSRAQAEARHSADGTRGANATRLYAPLLTLYYSILYTRTPGRCECISPSGVLSARNLISRMNLEYIVAHFPIGFCSADFSFARAARIFEGLLLNYMRSQASQASSVSLKIESLSSLIEILGMKRARFRAQ